MNFFTFKNSISYLSGTFFFGHFMRYIFSSLLNVGWIFGSMLLIIFSFQLITGLLAASHFFSENAFEGLDFLLRNIIYGWFLKYYHALGASFFFIGIYSHMIGSIFYGLYGNPGHILWFSGGVLYICLMATSFLGYALPWGQMSYWGITVISSMLTSVPFVGNKLVELLWGGFVVENVTLRRFYMFHFVLPFLLFGFIFFHFYELHKIGSSSPFGVFVSYAYARTDLVSFYSFKDIKYYLIIFIFIVLFLYFFPDIFTHFLNYIIANFLVTPSHIVPEWYFLYYYAILRSVPNKELGILLMASVIFCLILLPYLIIGFFYLNDWVISHDSDDYYLRDLLLFFFFLGSFVSLSIGGSLYPSVNNAINSLIDLGNIFMYLIYEY